MTVQERSFRLITATKFGKEILQLKLFFQINRDTQLAVRVFFLPEPSFVAARGESARFLPAE
jgi:hypothetical protein